MKSNTNYNPQTASLVGGLGGLLGGLFGDSEAPYGEAMDQYQQWANKSQAAQNPFYNAGVGATGDYQQFLHGIGGASDNYKNWLQTMSNPSEFLNNLMGQYKESPNARYQQQQAMRAGQNSASASGLMGSTPMMEQMQQNAANISSQDQNQWLQNVLGINNQYGAGQGALTGIYGQGQQRLMGQGANSANALTSMYGDMGRQMGEQAYNQKAAGQNDMWNTIGGVASLASLFL